MGGGKEAAHWGDGAHAADGLGACGSRDPHGDAGENVLSGAADACDDNRRTGTWTIAGQDAHAYTTGDQGKCMVPSEAKRCGMEPTQAKTHMATP